jgi:hypothetical protein
VQDLRRQQLRSRKSNVSFFMDNIMQRDEWSAVRIAVVAALTVYQQGFAQPELLTPPDVDVTLHRRFLG